MSNKVDLANELKKCIRTLPWAGVYAFSHQCEAKAFQRIAIQTHATIYVIS